MNKGEIVNFRAYASRRKGDKLYMMLFDAILEMTVYDEEILKERFKTEKFIRHLYKTKNYLYKIILDSLVGINQEDEYELYTQIQKIIILTLKSLYAHAESLFPDAYKIAEEQENFEAFRILLNEERNLIKAKDTSPYLNERLIQIKGTEKELAAKSYNLTQYTHLLDKANSLQWKQADRRKEEIDEILKDPLMVESRNFGSVSARILYWLIKGKVNQTLSRYDLVMVALENAAELYEQHPNLIRESIGFLYYLDVLENLFIANLAGARHERAIRISEKVKNLSRPGEKGHFLVQERYFYIMLAYVGHVKDVALGEKIIPEYKAFVAAFTGIANRKFQLLNTYILAVFYLKTGRSAESVTWFYQVLNERDSSIRKDIHINSRVLLVVALLDSHDLKYLSNAIRSARDVLRRADRLGEVEKMLLRFFNRLGENMDLETTRRKVLQEFLTNWSKAKNKEGHNWWRSTFDFEVWVKRLLEA